VKSGNHEHGLHSDLKRRKYHSGEVIFNQGEPGDVVHVLRQGKVEIRCDAKAGESRQLAVLLPGDIFGEMALFDERPRMASAIAQGECETIVVSKDEFQRRIGHTDPAIRHLIMLLIHRLREADQRLSGDQHLQRTHWSAGNDSGSQ
jgi:CRP-like cAMP-binding protein